MEGFSIRRGVDEMIINNYFHLSKFFETVCQKNCELSIIIIIVIIIISVFWVFQICVYFYLGLVVICQLTQ